MKDAWKSGDPYEVFMGRWSRLVGRSFIDWLSPSPGLRWLDVGCGTGALSEAVLHTQEPSELTAIDQSEGFVKSAQARLGPRARCRVANAMDLPMGDDSMDFAVSGLVLNFIPSPEKALQEMKRVTRPGGTVAVYIWDYPGKMEFLNAFWDAVIALDPEASDLHEGARFPDATSKGLKRIFATAGFTETTATAIDIDTSFLDFEDYWAPFLGGQGPAPTYVGSLKTTDRTRLRARLKDRLPIQPDGRILLEARAWAVRSEG